MKKIADINYQQKSCCACGKDLNLVSTEDVVKITKNNQIMYHCLCNCQIISQPMTTEVVIISSENYIALKEGEIA